MCQACVTFVDKFCKKVYLSTIYSHLDYTYVMYERKIIYILKIIIEIN